MYNSNKNFPDFSEIPDQFCVEWKGCFCLLHNRVFERSAKLNLMGTRLTMHKSDLLCGPSGFPGLKMTEVLFCSLYMRILSKICVLCWKPLPLFKLFSRIFAHVKF